jgi:hypothetical protein
MLTYCGACGCCWLLAAGDDDWAAALDDFDTALDAQPVEQQGPSKEEQELAAAKAMVGQASVSQLLALWCCQCFVFCTQSLSKVLHKQFGRSKGFYRVCCAVARCDAV